MQHEDFMRQAVALARANIAEGGRPFGAVVVREGEVVAGAANGIHRDHDPTAHAELLAIRTAAHRLGTPRLQDCVVYASGHPCPMCLAAMHLCGISQAWYAYGNEDGEPYGLSTSIVYQEMARPPEDHLALQLRALKPEGEHGLYDAWAARG